MKVALCLLMVAQFSVADELTEPLEDFSYQSISKLAGIENNVKSEHEIRIIQLSRISRIRGLLSNITLHGLGNLQNITTHVKKAQNMGTWLSYNVMIPSIVMRGDYIIVGKIATKIPFNGKGEFQIKLIEATELFCCISLVHNLGYVIPEEQCRLEIFNSSLKRAQMIFPGLAENETQLDAELRDFLIHQIIHKSDFPRLIFYLLTRTINENLQSSFQEHKLLEILTSHNETSRKQQSFLNLHQPFPRPQVIEETEIDRRLAKFVAKAMVDLSNKGKCPISLNDSIVFDNTRALLFPTFGQLLDLKLIGLDSMHNVNVTFLNEELYRIEFDLQNFGISGHYNISGSISGEETRNWDDEFNITALVNLRFSVDSQLHRYHMGSFDRGYETKSSELQCNSGNYNFNFKHLYTLTGLTKELEAKASESVGMHLLCSPHGVSLLNERIIKLVYNHVRGFSRNVSIADVITLK